MATPVSGAPQHAIAAVRRFNRFYTQRLGLLQRAWLDSPFSLTEARVLYEIRQRGRATATEIARDLGLDAGYLSRILRRFQADGLIDRQVSAEDGRQSVLSMTEHGRSEFEPLETRSRLQVGAVLDRLPPAGQQQLVAAMQSIECLMTEQPVATPAITMRQPRPGDLGWVVARHAEVYAEEYGWADNFEGVCAQIVADFAKNFDPARERCWIAERDGRPVGSVFLVKDGDTVARLRLLLVDPAARGQRLGARLTDECIVFARQSGYDRITLWTHEVLTAARLIYQLAGFRLASSEPMRNFGHDVVSEHWNLDLRTG